MSSNPVAISQFVRERRDTLGLSMTVLADATGLSRSTIDRTENPKRGISPEPRTLAKVLVALNVSEDSIRELLEPGDYRDDVLYESSNPRLITRRQDQDPLVAAISRLAGAVERMASRD